MFAALLHSGFIYAFVVNNVCLITAFMVFCLIPVATAFKAVILDHSILHLIPTIAFVLTIIITWSYRRDLLSVLKVFEDNLTEVVVENEKADDNDNIDEVQEKNCDKNAN